MSRMGTGLASRRTGALAQLVEHYLDKVGVSGSSPLRPTRYKCRSEPVFICRKVGDILADIGFGPHLVHIDEIPGV
jgi:hypothetical protein